MCSSLVQRRVCRECTGMDGWMNNRQRHTQGSKHTTHGRETLSFILCAKCTWRGSCMHACCITCRHVHPTPHAGHPNSSTCMVRALFRTGGRHLQERGCNMGEIMMHASTSNNTRQSIFTTRRLGKRKDPSTSCTVPRVWIEPKDCLRAFVRFDNQLGILGQQGCGQSQ